jgi:hypothetical protein
MEDKTTGGGGTQDMINIFENNNASNSTSADFLHSMSDKSSVISNVVIPYSECFV